MKSLINSTIVLIIFSLFVVSCGDVSDESDKESDEVTEEKTEKSIQSMTDEDFPYTVTPMSKSPTYDNAKIEEMSYEDGTFSYTIPEGEYELGVQTSDAETKMCANSAKGQHIHLIVNNEPYSAHYTSEFDYEMEDGDYYILSFLSRSYHESIKDAEASRAIAAKVKDKSIVGSKEIDEPVLFYSRPKGTYFGKDTEKVMLDFYLVNTNMNEHKVKLEINENTMILDKWQPFLIEGLPKGENMFTLTLIDNDGNVVDAPLNPVSRRVTLKEDPANQ